MHASSDFQHMTWMGGKELQFSEVAMLLLMLKNSTRKRSEIVIEPEYSMWICRARAKGGDTIAANKRGRNA